MNGTVEDKRDQNFFGFNIHQHTPTHPIVLFSGFFVVCTIVQSGMLAYVGESSYFYIPPVYLTNDRDPKGACSACLLFCSCLANSLRTGLSTLAVQLLPEGATDSDD